MFRRTLYLFCFLTAVGSLKGQTVLFDGLVHGAGNSAAMLVPAAITGDNYTTLARYEYGMADRVNLFGILGGNFGGGSRGLAGAGWSATVLRATDDFPVNFGFFNSFVFPIEDGGPDVLVTLSPVFSHSWKRKSGGAITGYTGATATLKEGGFSPRSRGARTDVNLLLGVKVEEVVDRWDFFLELQPGEESQFAIGFQYRF